MKPSVYYFGYGSLVNRHTRAADEPYLRATLHGWVRQWAHQARRPWNHVDRAGKGVCALTVAERASSHIDGVLVPIDEEKLPQLDQREAGYDRVTLPLSAFTTHTDERHLDLCPTGKARIVMYVSGAAQNQWADAEHPMTISYVHCVMRGFADQFGADGLRRLMGSTEGWALPLHDDRHLPLYPRAVAQTDTQLHALDQCLAENLAARPVSGAGDG